MKALNSNTTIVSINHTQKPYRREPFHQIQIQLLFLLIFIFIIFWHKTNIIQIQLLFLLIFIFWFRAVNFEYSNTTIVSINQLGLT